MIVINKKILWGMLFMKNKVILGLLLVSLFMSGCTSKENINTSETVTNQNSLETEVANNETEITVVDETAGDIDFTDSEQKSIDSLVKLSDGVYFMDCYNDYKLDDYLSANIQTIEDCDRWLTNNITYGKPTGDFPDIACCSFSTTDLDGNHLFGRNFELSVGDSMIIRTNPENGYSSIGVVYLRNINLGVKGEYDIDDEESKSLLLAAPWGICDGINEKGLGASLLELSKRHDVVDTEKNDLLCYTVVRVVLDKCADVDEAIELLQNYDLFSGRQNTYHIFLTDATGCSVVVEWWGGEMYVIEDTAVTNLKLYEGNPSYCWRYRGMHEVIDVTPSMTSEEAMSLLADVAQSGNVDWSAVYNLENFSVEVCFFEDYSQTYHYEGRLD